MQTFINSNSENMNIMLHLGCFLSHYRIWHKIVDEGFDRVLVLEDDVRFSENGTLILDALMEVIN